MSRLRYLFALLVLACLTTAQQVFIPVSMEELCRMSDVIVDGQVTAVKQARAAQGKLETPVSILVAAVLKGPPELKALELLEPGGRLDKREEIYFNQAIPTLGERYILFLRREGDAYRTLGGLHGQYRIVGGRVVAYPAMARILRAEFDGVPAETLLQSIRVELSKP